MKEYIIKYLVASTILSLIIFFLYNSGIYTAFYKIKYPDILLSTSICLLIFFISGLRLSYSSKLTCGIPLSLLDTITLPIAMNLWGYLIPIKGGMLYCIFYLKKKYGIKLNKGAAISIFTYSTTLSILGVVLLFINLYVNEQRMIINIISITLISNLFLVYLSNKLLCTLSFGNKTGIIRKVKNIIRKILEDLLTAVNNIKLVSISLLLSLIHISATFLWYYSATDSLNLNLSIVSVLLLVLASHLSMIIKILPGNLGFTEALMGATTVLTEDSLENGLALAIFIRSVNLLVTLSIGVITASLHLSEFKSISVLSLTKRLNENKIE